MFIESSKNQVIVWLEDFIEEIEDSVAELQQMGFEVRQCQALTQLHDELVELSKTKELTICAIVLDIMLEGVTDLSKYFPGIPNAISAHGYSAGLVFLERVLIESDLYPFCKGIPIFLHSKRALADAERERVYDLTKDHSARIETIEKLGLESIVTALAGLKAP